MQKITAEQPREAKELTNLGPGKSAFKVTATNNDGAWNPVGASVTFTIPPRYYQTIWFRLAVLAAALLLIWYLLSLRI